MKLIIEVDDDIAKGIRGENDCKVEPREIVRSFQATISKAIVNGTPYEERPQGEWKFDDTEQFCYCSNCEDTYYPRPLDPSWYYCPHCGAKMENG